MEFENSKKLSSAVNEEIVSITKAVRESDVTMYDNAVVLGADVLNFAKKHFGRGAPKESFYMQVSTGSGNTYIISDSASYEAFSRAFAGDVGAASGYACRVLNNMNGVITGVEFSAE